MVPSLSVVIPVLNEEDVVGRILGASIEALDRRGAEFEVVIVDNASTDGTHERASSFVDGTRVRYLLNDSNRGKGYSIRRGMLEARGELRLMCDADCVTSLASLPHLEERVAAGADVVVGSRLASGASVERQQPIRRRIVGAGFLAYTRLMIGRLPRDVYCGFKLWRGAVADVVFQHAVLDGWAFDAEALALARRLGYRVEEVGIDWSNRPASRLSIGNVLVPVTLELLTARRNIRQVLVEQERALAPPVKAV